MDKSTDALRNEKQNPTIPQSFMNYSDKNAADIQREIKLTRAEMDETVSAIQARISPQHLMHNAVDMVRDAIRSSTPRLVEAIRDNPIPTALVAIGVGWLFVKAAEGAVERQARSYGYNPGGPEDEYRTGQGSRNALGELSDKTGEAADKIKDATGRIAGQARQKAGELASEAKEKMSQFGDATRRKAGQLADASMEKVSDLAEATWDKAGSLTHQAGQQMSRLGHAARMQVGRAADDTYEMFRGNPLAFGALCVGVGAAVALSLPETRQEQDLMGEAAGKVVSQAKEAGQQTLEKIEHVVEAGQQAIKEEAQKEDLL